MLHAVIMAGGSGTRFWPASRASRPKQLLPIVGDDTLIQATVARLQPLIPPERVLVITTAAIAAATLEQLPMLKPEQIIAEPFGRDTAACVALAASIVAKTDPDGIMLIISADQTISPVVAWQRAVSTAVTRAQLGKLLVYGIRPRFAATGYGYIQLGTQKLFEQADSSVYAVQRFVEKPAKDVAEQYLAGGAHLWNAGMFTWRADVCLNKLRQHCPGLVEAIAPATAAYGSPDFAAALLAAYTPLKKISIDYALMEKASDIEVVLGSYAWDDVGGWDALYDHRPADAQGVHAKGQVLAIGCSDCLIESGPGAPMIAAVGMRGVTIVATADAILVIPKGEGQQVKQVVEALQKSGNTGVL